MSRPPTSRFSPAQSSFVGQPASPGRTRARRVKGAKADHAPLLNRPGMVAIAAISSLRVIAVLNPSSAAIQAADLLSALRLKSEVVSDEGDDPGPDAWGDTVVVVSVIAFENHRNMEREKLLAKLARREGNMRELVLVSVVDSNTGGSPEPDDVRLDQV